VRSANVLRQRRIVEMVPRLEANHGTRRAGDPAQTSLAMTSAYSHAKPSERSAEALAV
jgi:hypothetical protein